LECPVYTDLQALGGSLFDRCRLILLLPCESCSLVSTPSHFRPLACLVRAVCARRQRVCCWNWPYRPLPFPGSAPRGVLRDVWAFPVGLGVLVADLLLAHCCCPADSLSCLLLSSCSRPIALFGRSGFAHTHTLFQGSKHCDENLRISGCNWTTQCAKTQHTIE